MKKIRNGIAIMLTVLLAFLLCSCAGNTDRAKNGVKITATDAKTEQTEESIVKAMMDKYEVDEAAVKADVNELLNLLKSKNLIEE